ETRGEADAQCRPEELLDPGVERTEDAIELVLPDRLVGQLPDEEDGVLLTDGEGRAVQLEVPPQEVLVELLVVLLRRRHDVGLVVEGPLPQGEPDGEGVLLLTLHPEVPPPLLGSAAV